MNKNITTQFFLRYMPKDKNKTGATLFVSNSKEDIFEKYMRQSESNPKDDYRIDKVTTQIEVIAQTTDFRQATFDF